MQLILWPPTPVTVNTSPIEFQLDGVDTIVNRDTVTPGNSRGLPVVNLDAAGNVATPLTDAQLRATPVPVSGPLTDAQLRAVAVPVSGPLTDVQLRASAVPVSLAASPLPTGAATEAKQDVGNTSLGTIATQTVDIPNVIAAEGGTQPSKGVVVMGHTGAGVVRHILVDATGRQVVSVTASSLPTGAATEAKQDTGNTSLASIVTNTNARALSSTLGQLAVSGTLSAPANVKGYTIQNSTRAAGALRFREGSGASASVGFLLEPGQSTSYQDGAANLSIFDVDGAGIDCTVLWYV